MTSASPTVSLGEAHPAEAGREAATRPVVHRRAIPLSLAVVLVPGLAGLARLLIGLHRPMALSGDAAILATAVRRVATGTQALGPYSRFGFHHPGPAYFFVQAPFSWLTGDSPRSLFLGALAVNFGAAAASVAVVRRFVGEPAARWSAVVVAAYLLAVTPAFLTDPWNPLVLAVPLLLTILLAAAAAAGSWTAAAGAAVIGSYVVQTHVGTAVVLVTVAGTALTVGVPGWWRGGRRRARDTTGGPPATSSPVPLGARFRLRRRATLGAAVVLLALLWVPPLIEQATHSPGNLTLLARFFAHPHRAYDAGVDHRLGTATRQVAAQLVTVPFGRAPVGHRPARDAAAVLGVVVAAAVGWAGWRRRNLFVASLGGSSLTGSLVAIWATTRIVGDVMPYLLAWAGVLLLPAWIGLGLLLRPSVFARRPARWAATGLAGAVALALTWSMVRAPLPPVRTDPGVAAVTQLARPWLADRGAGRVRVRLGGLAHWPLAAGVIDVLERRGIDVTVDRQFVSLFGDQFTPTGHEPAELWLTGPDDRPPGLSPQRLGTVGTASVWAGRLDTGGQP